MNKSACGNSDFNAERFVNKLLKKGATVACDQSNSFFNQSLALPEDFDEAKFKRYLVLLVLWSPFQALKYYRGQQFYHEHIFGMLIAKLLGLITVLAIPSILRVLSLTNHSSTPKSAFRRYMSTILHMNVWYTDNFAPGSNLWKSLENVRERHNSASKFNARSSTCSISQLDMALTQFGFMGYVLTHPREVGIYYANVYGLHCWIYLWRVIGQIMGIQPEFNICRHSVSETKAICALLIDKAIKPNVEQQDAQFLNMSTVLINGMTAMQPFLRPFWLFLKLLKLACPDSEALQNVESSLTSREKQLVRMVDVAIRSYEYRIVHWILNFLMRACFWMMHNFPILAILRFGWQDAYVRILQSVSVASCPLQRA